MLIVYRSTKILQLQFTFGKNRSPEQLRRRMINIIGLIKRICKRYESASEKKSFTMAMWLRNLNDDNLSVTIVGSSLLKVGDFHVKKLFS